MPLARIDVPAGNTPDYRATIGAVVYDAMIDALKVPKDDRFQIIAEHAPSDLVVDPTYLGIQRSAQCIIIQLTLNEGRSVDVKKAFYMAVADGLQARLGIRKEDVFINLVEVKKENWSFGNGEAQYA
jgi:4-oxalocrotonate tautomerase